MVFLDRIWVGNNSPLYYLERITLTHLNLPKITTVCFETNLYFSSINIFTKRKRKSRIYGMIREANTIF